MNLTLSVPDCLGCCDTCPTTGSLDAVVSGYTACGCTSTGSPTPPVTYDVVAHTGITGAHSIPIVTPGFSFWEGVIGTVDIQLYSDVCTTPFGGGPGADDVLMQINCTGYNQIDVAILLTGGTIVFSGSGTFGEAIANVQECTGGPIFNLPFTIDTVTITEP